MNLSTPIAKFVTVRSPTDQVTSPPELEIQPATNLVQSLIGIIESDKKQPETIRLINQKLQAFIQSKSFFKSKAEALKTTSRVKPPSPNVSSKRTTARHKHSTALKELYDTLYDNIVVRILTKSNTNEVFKSLTQHLRTLHQQLNAEKVDAERIHKLRILLPERLVIAFSPPKPPSPPIIEKDQSPLLLKLQVLSQQRKRVQESRHENASAIRLERKRILSAQSTAAQAPMRQSQSTQRRSAKTTPESSEQATRQVINSALLDNLEVKAMELESSEKQLDSQLTESSAEMFQMFSPVKYARVGEQWINVTNFVETLPATIEGASIVIHSEGCSLKFPFQVADLRVVEQQTVGYLPAEIAHINNTQQGEFHEKITRKLQQSETFESLITEDEVSQQTDIQSGEKFTLEKAATDVQSEDNAFNVNTSASGTYGVVTASIDAGYSTSQSSQNSNSASQSYAKELVQRVVDRVSNRVRTERSVKRLEQVEETVKHVIDNTSSKSSKSNVWRWLKKLSRATLRNYGKRLMFQIDIAHPSQYYLSRSLTGPSVVSLPPDPRKLGVGGERLFRIDNINRQNFSAWADLYGAKLEAPPDEKIIVSYVNSGKKGENADKVLNPIPDGYCAVRAHIKRTVVGQHNENSQQFAFVSILVGRTDTADWIVPSSDSTSTRLEQRDLDRERKFIPISIIAPFGAFAVNIEMDCELTPEGERAWQVKCYHAILEAYDTLKAEAENKMSEFDPNRPGLNPSRKTELIKSELKKGALSKMFRCNPFWIADDYVVGQEYDPECCKDTLNAEKVRFLETLFDWRNMTYELHPYLYADKDNWAKLLDLSDGDPHFEAFLQASFATVRIPVYRDALKETAAVNFILNNSIANYEVVPASMKPLLDELDNGEPTTFTTGLNGEQLAVPVAVTDLGIFPVPTDLIILECGVESGVKPIGFPQEEAEDSDVSIPKQYSPAIIADRCDGTPAPPEDAEPEAP